MYNGWKSSAEPDSVWYFSVHLDKNYVNVLWNAPLSPLVRFWGHLPLQIGAASTKLYIERGADWCRQGKNNSFFEGCGMSTCQYGIMTCKQFGWSFFGSISHPHFCPHLPFPFTPTKSFACFLRHAKKKIAIKRNFQIPKWWKEKGDLGKIDLLGTVWLAKGWAVHEDSLELKYTISNVNARYCIPEGL